MDGRRSEAERLEQLAREERSLARAQTLAAEADRLRGADAARAARAPLLPIFRN